MNHRPGCCPTGREKHVSLQVDVEPGNEATKLVPRLFLCVLRKVKATAEISF